jgi:hypothetical protein
MINVIGAKLRILDLLPAIRKFVVITIQQVLDWFTLESGIQPLGGLSHMIDEIHVSLIGEGNLPIGWQLSQFFFCPLDFFSPPLLFLVQRVRVQSGGLYSGLVPLAFTRG